MNEPVGKAKGGAVVRLQLMQFFTFCRQNLRGIACTAVLFVIVSELGGIWYDVHKMQTEQVKNAMHALPKERQDALHKTVAGRRLESTTYVNGEVSVDGEVELSQPVTVEIDR